MDAAGPLVIPVMVVLQATLRRPATEQDTHIFTKILRRIAERIPTRIRELTMIKLISHIAPMPHPIYVITPLRSVISGLYLDSFLFTSLALRQIKRSRHACFFRAETTKIYWFEITSLIPVDFTRTRLILFPN